MYKAGLKSVVNVDKKTTEHNRKTAVISNLCAEIFRYACKVYHWSFSQFFILLSRFLKLFYIRQHGQKCILTRESSYCFSAS